jgi:hypothetical protein
MDLLQAIGQIDGAEDLFALLEVSFDPAVLAVHRIHILKRFGLEIGVLERRDPPLSESERPAPLRGGALATNPRPLRARRQRYRAVPSARARALW